MVDLSKLLCGMATPGDSLRYSQGSHRRPVVVWNLTRRCNLSCLHCYANAGPGESPGELTTPEAKGVIEDLARYGVPVVLFSGGEPTLRPDLLELARYAAGLGLRAVVSTNGTLITPELAQGMKRAGVSYVGVSLDGLEATHDYFRGRAGAFRAALSGLAACREAGLRTGLRFTITRFSRPQIPGLFQLLEEEGIDRLCFYHLVYSGRGSQLRAWDLTQEERREVMDTLFARTRDLARRGLAKDILTVDNHADGVYLYLRLKQEEPERAQEVYNFLARNGGNSTGVGISAIGWRGDVHPDQFWSHYTLGNVREKPFSHLWRDGGDPLLMGLRSRKGRIGGKCGRCRYFDLCGGNFRVRAEAVYGDVWAEDPACYLTEEEIRIG